MSSSRSHRPPAITTKERLTPISLDVGWKPAPHTPLSASARAALGGASSDEETETMREQELKTPPLSASRQQSPASGRARAGSGSLHARSASASSRLSGLPPTGAIPRSGSNAARCLTPTSRTSCISGSKRVAPASAPNGAPASMKAKRSHSHMLSGSFAAEAAAAAGIFSPSPIPSVSLPCYNELEEVPLILPTPSVTSPSPTHSAADFTLVILRSLFLATAGARIRGQIARVVNWINSQVGGLPVSPREGVERILREDELLYIMVSSTSRKKDVCAAAIVKHIQFAWKMEHRASSAFASPSASRMNQLGSPAPSAARLQQTPSPLLHAAEHSQPTDAATQPLEDEMDIDEMAHHADHDTAKAAAPDISPVSVAAFNSPTISASETKSSDPSSDQPAAKRQRLVVSTSALLARTPSTMTAVSIASMMDLDHLSSPASLQKPAAKAPSSSASHQRSQSASMVVSSSTSAAPSPPISSLRLARMLLLPASLSPSPSVAAQTSPSISRSAALPPARAASSPRLSPAVLGIEKIVVSSRHRRRGLATLLLDGIREHRAEWSRERMDGVRVEEVAFSEPLEEGCRLATKYCGTPEFLTY